MALGSVPRREEMLPDAVNCLMSTAMTPIPILVDRQEARTLSLVTKGRSSSPSVLLLGDAGGLDSALVSFCAEFEKRMRGLRSGLEMDASSPALLKPLMGFHPGVDDSGVSAASSQAQGAFSSARLLGLGEKTL